MLIGSLEYVRASVRKVMIMAASTFQVWESEMQEDASSKALLFDTCFHGHDHIWNKISLPISLVSLLSACFLYFQRPC